MADATAPIHISTVGSVTGKPYNGKFLIKTVLNRRENFLADERRRYILGGNPNSAPPALQGEAYMLGQLFVRIVEAPDWWKQSDSGLDIEDDNVIGELYKAAEAAASDREKVIQDEAKASLEQLAKNPSKKVETKKQSAVADKDE